LSWQQIKYRQSYFFFVLKMLAAELLRKKQKVELPPSGSPSSPRSTSSGSTARALENVKHFTGTHA
jgi:hypothetical protein